MSLRTVHVISLSLLTTALFAACSDDDASTTTGATSAASTTSSSGGGEGGAGGQGGAATTVGSGGATSTSTTSATTSTGTGGTPIVCDPFPTTGVVLAVNNLFVGETDPGGVSSSNAWKQYGFDVDGMVSTAQSAGLCMLVNGAPASTHDDGNNGTDNSFGKNVLPLLLATSSDPSAQINASIAAGEFTLMMYLKDLAAAPDQTPVLTNLYTGGQATPPLFDGNDCWPTAAESLLDPADIDTPKVSFPLASVQADVWTSGIADTLDLTLLVSGFPLKLTLHKARLSLNLSADHQAGTSGQLGGVLNAQEFIDAVQDVVAPMFGGCSSGTWQAIAGQLKQAADIMTDGSQDPNASCDGISIGLGFTATKVALGTIADPVPAAVDPCP